MDTVQREFISYGIDFCEEKFDQPSNKVWYLNKPWGGLWSSPVDSKWGWKDWCECENFRVERIESCWTKFHLAPGTRIIEIDGLGDLIGVQSRYPLDFPDPLIMSQFSKLIDWEAMVADGWDGVLLTEQGNVECHLPLGRSLDDCYVDLNSWDCESMVVFNTKCLVIDEVWRK